MVQVAFEVYMSQPSTLMQKTRSLLPELCRWVLSHK